MELKKRKPTSPGSRHQVVPIKFALSKEKSLKYLRCRKNQSSGRNDSGKISVRRIGKGLRYLTKALAPYKLEEDRTSVRGIVLSTEYASGRSALLHKVFDLKNKNFFYTLAVNKLHPGCMVEQGSGEEFFLGYRRPLKNIPAG